MTRSPIIAQGHRVVRLPTEADLRAIEAHLDKLPIEERNDAGEWRWLVAGAIAALAVVAVVL